MRTTKSIRWYSRKFASSATTYIADINGAIQHRNTNRLRCCGHCYARSFIDSTDCYSYGGTIRLFMGRLVRSYRYRFTNQPSRFLFFSPDAWLRNRFNYAQKTGGLFRNRPNRFSSSHFGSGIWYAKQKTSISIGGSVRSAKTFIRFATFRLSDRRSQRFADHSRKLTKRLCTCSRVRKS